MSNTLPLSPGLQLLCAVCAGDVSIHPSALERDLFTQSEEVAFDVFHHHYTTYNLLPDTSVFRESGIPFPSSVSQPATFYFDKCRRRRERLILAAIKKEVDKELNKSDSADSESIPLLTDAIQEIQRYSISNNVLRDHDYYQELLNAARSPIEAVLRAERTVDLGYAYLNELTGGLNTGDIFLLSGRPGMGKTYITLNMAVQQINQNKKTLFVTMEMSPSAVCQRVIEMTVGLPKASLRRAELDYFQQQILERHIRRRQETGVQGFLLPNDIKLARNVSEVVAVIEKEDPSVVFVDGVYLLSPTNNSPRMNNIERVAEVVSELKHHALRLNKPFILTTQLNRQAPKVGARNAASNEVDLTHIGGSDVFGQIASVVLAVTKDQRFGSNKRLCHIIKNRDGDVGRMLVNFDFNPHNFSFDRVITDEEFESGEIAIDEDRWA